MIIGICGKSGCGKSTLSRELLKNHTNAIHLDIDKIGHKVLELETVQNKLEKTFGSSIKNDNNIDRKKLGELVFTSKIKMNKLSAITWEYMQMEIDQIIRNNKDKLIILDWILLQSSKYFDICDIKILLDIPYETRKERALKRDNISKDDFDLREQASIDFDKKQFDYVLNDTNSETIKRMVKII